MPPWAMLLEAGVDEGVDGNGGDTDATTTWICVACQQLVIMPIDLTVLLNLLNAGAPMVIEPDDGLSEQPAAPAGPPLTFDELIDFHESLQQDDALAELRGDTDLCHGC